MKILFLVFLFVPLVEIYFLIQIGSVIGAGWTMFAVVITALLGAALVRAQGFSTLARVQKQLAQGNMPAIEVLEGVFLLVAGALLLTPGFFTDAIGFAFLTPPVRRWLIRYFLQRGVLGQFSAGPARQPQNDRAIDVDFKDVE
ncbi:MAG: FxsA family protein [Pseudomonadota bacterium]|nr:FxsA family protein [Pseudomonadota bacterium]